MARNKKVEILSNDKEVLHPMTDGDCVIFEDGQTLTQKLSEDDSVKYTPEIVNSSPMFKVGEGNTVDYSDNVLDGAYERATLQGQTYVNYIQESSADEVTLPTPFTEYERTQHNTLTSNEEGTLGINLVGQSYVNALQHDSEEEFVVLGESLEFQEKKVEYTNEGQIKSAMLKGQTLVNLATTTNFSMTTGGSCPHFIGDRTIAPNTYTIIADITISGVGECMFAFYEYYGMTRSNTRSFTESGRYVWTENIINTKIGSYGFYALQGSSTDTTYTLNNLVILEGDHTNEDIPYFEGMQSVTVSTRLENLCHKHTTSSLAKNGKTFTTNSLYDRCIPLVDYKDSAETTYGMKPNTKYLVQFKISNLVLDGLSSLGLVFSVGDSGTTNYLFKDASKVGLITANGVYRVVLTTSDVVSTSGVEIKGFALEWEQSGSTLRSMTISEIMYVEYQNGMENWDLPYFEDYQVMKPVQVESVNKNLQPLGTYTTSTSNNVSTLNDVNGYIRVVPGKKYRISCGAEIAGCTMRWFDRNKKQLEDANGSYREAPANAYYMRLLINTDLDYLNTVQVEESADGTASAYIDNKSKTTYSWDEVILRKIGDVEDTLDLTTGEWVQRIGEIVLDGSDDEQWISSTATDDEGFYTMQIDMHNIIYYISGISQDSIIKADKFLNSTIVEGSKSGTFFDGWGLYIRVPLATKLASDYRAYLQTNPVTVQYLLKTPKIHKVNLSRPNLQVYDDITHVHTRCLDGTLIPNIYLPAEVSYPVGVESETVYNVCVNHEVSSSNPLVCNVGGSTFTVTQPRTLITVPQGTKTISFSGKDNVISEVMMIKNSSLLTRDLPHFNGVSSVQLGKTITNLCNTNAFKAGNSNSTLTWNKDYVHVNVSNTTGSCVFTFELTKQLENGKKYFVYAKNNLGGTADVASFRRVYNGSLSYARQQTHIENNWCIVEVDQQDNPYTHLCVGCHHNIPLGTEFDVYYPIICEYEQGMENWDWESIGYFTGTKNIGCEFMKVRNRNLLTKNFTCCTLNTTLNTWYIEYHEELQIQARSRAYSGLYKIKHGATYTVSSKDNTLNLAIHFGFENQPMALDSGWQRKQSYTFTNTGNYDIIAVYVAKRDDSLWTGKAEINNLINIVQLEESSSATSYTAHKENTLYVRKDQPIELTWEQGRINPSGVGDSYTNAINNTVSYGVRNKGLLNLKPNTTYRLSLGDTTTYRWHIALFDNWDCALQANNLFGLSGDWSTAPETFITTTKDYHKIGINIQRQDSGSLSASTVIPCRLEEVEEIKLRSASGKYDELDITRGKYIQRIGELYVDGKNITSNNISKVGDTYQPTDTTLNTYDIKCPGAIFSTRVHINHFAPRNGATESAGISYESAAIHSANQSCRITISKSKASTLEEFKAWLSKNPLTIVYALNDSSEIEHDIVFIGNKNESGTEIAKPNGVFTLPTLYAEQTNIELQNNGLMPKVQSRDYIAYPVLPMISRTYTLQHNLTGGVSNLTVDLLGRTQSVSYQNHKSLIYSPETMDAILHNELRISGKGKISKVMYIDGGYMDRDIPYIEGMKNAVNPIVKNVGKNLITDKIVDSYSDVVIFEICKLKPNKQYIISSNYNFTQGLVVLQGNNKEFIIQDWTQNKNVFKAPTDVYDYNTIKFWKARLSYDKANMYFHMQELEDEVQSISYEPYKENICYVDCGEIRLTPDMFEQGNFGSDGSKTYEENKTTAKNRYRVKTLVKVEPNTTYNIHHTEYDSAVFEYGKDEKKLTLGYNINKSTLTITTSNDCYYLAFNFVTSTLPTQYVSITKVSEIKQMRSLPNGVRDEIDLETGKYIQRIGEMTLNDNDYIIDYFAAESTNEYSLFAFVRNDIKNAINEDDKTQALCDKLPYEHIWKDKDREGFFISNDRHRIFIRISNNKLSGQSVDALNEYLASNPIKAQYVLDTPIIKHVDIHNYPHSYEGGHVIIENGDPNTPIPAQLTYRAVTNRSGQIQQHTEQVEKQEREINELETLILANIHLSQTR